MAVARIGTDVGSLSREQIRHFDSMTQRWAPDGHTCVSRRVLRKRTVKQQRSHYRTLLRSDWTVSN